MKLYPGRDYKKNLIAYWRQYYPNWTIPKGYHVHHIKPVCTFEDRSDLMVHHPRNLIALHVDDHITIHELRGDKFTNSGLLRSIAGRKFTKGARLRMARAKLGKKRPPEVIEKIANTNKGKKRSAEARKNMSNGQKNMSPAMKEKRSKMLRNRKASDETKKKMSLSMTGLKRSEESKRRMSEVRMGVTSPNKGRKWYNNGIKQSLYHEDSVPAGFVPGRIKGWKWRKNEHTH